MNENTLIHDELCEIDLGIPGCNCAARAVRSPVSGPHDRRCERDNLDDHCNCDLRALRLLLEQALPLVAQVEPQDGRASKRDRLLAKRTFQTVEPRDGRASWAIAPQVWRARALKTLGLEDDNQTADGSPYASHTERSTFDGNSEPVSSVCAACGGRLVVTHRTEYVGCGAIDHTDWDCQACGAHFDEAPVQLERLGAHPSYRPHDNPIPDGSDITHRHTSGAHSGVIECASNGNVLDLRCTPGHQFEIAPSLDDPTLVRVWIEKS